MAEGSICGLGQAAALPLTTGMKWFAEDFESRGGVLKYIGQYVTAEERKVLNNSKIKISYLYYNWKINH